MSPAMSHLMALAGKKLPIKKPKLEKAAKPSKLPVKPYLPIDQHTSSNKKILDLNTRITESQDYLKIVTEDLRSLRNFIGVITKANQALQTLVVARNAKALDVLGAFSGFRISKEITDLSGEEGLSTSIRTKVSDSVYRNATRDFVKFVASLGYTMSRNAEGGISTADMDAIIRGIRAGRALTKKYEITSLLDAIKQAGVLDTDVQEYTKSIAVMTEDRDRLVQLNRPTTKMSVPAESLIEQKQQDIRAVSIQSQNITSEITKLNAKIKVLGDLSGLTTQDVNKSITEMESTLSSIKSEYRDLQEKLKVRGVSKEAKDAKAIKLQEESLARRKTEKLLQLDAKYMQETPTAKKALISKFIKAWEKVERAKLAERNEQAGRVVTNTPGTATPEANLAKLNDLLDQITAVSDKLSVLKTASKLTAQERSALSDKLKSNLVFKKAELKNTAKKIARREAVKTAELDEDLWRGRISDKMSDADFVRKAYAHNAIRYFKNTLALGAGKRAKMMMDVAWSYFSRGKKAPAIKALSFKSKNSLAKIHFGGKGFVVDPKYMGMNDTLISALDTGIDVALSNLTPDNIEADLFYTVMDLLQKTPEALAAHKKMYDGYILLVNKAMQSRKVRLILEETVEELVSDGVIQTPNGTRVTKKYISTVVDNLLLVIKQSHAVHNLAKFAWPIFRDDSLSWARINFRIEQKNKRI